MVNIKKKAENIFEIEKEGKMNVPGIIFASEKLFEKIKKEEKTIEQVKNVAMLPGIVGKSIAMPDAHQGYGFCVGGVAAFDLEKGVISPGGVGYDLNCGVRLLVLDINKEEFMFKREAVLSELYKNVPSGVGVGSEFKFSLTELDEIMNMGCNWARDKDYASEEDIEHIEDNGCLKEADASKVSQRAKARGKDQLGTIGSGNHFLEIQEVERIFDGSVAKIFGLKKEGQIVVMIHTGSRGLGHQVASDYIMKIEKIYGFKHLPDRELAYAPLDSDIAKDYFGAMRAAANFAFVNRQIITHQIRKSFKKYFPKAKVRLVYDIAHNIAKFEEFEINGKKKTLCVHRKGATRSFGPGRKEICKEYRDVGCPILIPGSMGTASYVLVGTEKARELSFASTAHGAGRVLSRSFAKKNLSPEKLKKDMKDKDILIKSGSVSGLLEESPEAYKDVDEVVRISHELGIGKLVAKMRPLAVMKG
ncbi:MAG: RtcB family protein [Nanoarchaeota archaeon]